MAKKTKRKPRAAKSSTIKPVSVRETPKKSELTPAQQEVKISAAKGRPMLVWVGKRPLRSVTAFPAQHIESFNADSSIPISNAKIWHNWPKLYPRGGLLFHGDNKEVLAHLLANGFRGKVKLIYIDPPFDSGADYVRKVQLRGVSGTIRINGEGYALGEQIQYTDIWGNDNYLQFMYERFLLLQELLSEDGCIFVHTDWHKTHLLRALLDEVFLESNFRNEIIVRRGRKKNLQKQFQGIDALGVETDTILLYSKSPSTKLSLITIADRGAEEQWQSFWRGNVERTTMQYEILGFKPTHGQLMWGKERGLRAAENYKRYLEWKNSHGQKELIEYWKETGEQLEFVRYEDGARSPDYWIPPKGEGILGNEWLDIQAYSYGYDYKTEKHEELLERVLELASKPGDLVLDCFIGSGTTAAVAQRVARRWIGCDINKGAIQTTSKRLQTIINEQLDEEKKDGNQAELQLTTESKNGRNIPVTQFSFEVYRVNDYDLQIQHNEAVNIACEHIGVTRTHSDAFFDGTFSKKLVKVVPFNHPLSPLDLEEVKRELSARPGEDRDVVVVALGKELAADVWLEDWNRLRKKGDVPNKIEVIELRTDPKYGKFIKHEPAKARIKVARKEDKIHIVIEDFISPSIVERLSQQNGILQPKIDDWRSMVDCVMIDANYDGEVFNVMMSDVPEKKTDLVKGEYKIPAPKGKTKVAVKIVDMLGEEVLEARDV